VYLRVSLCAAELRLRTGAHRYVRTRSVTFADDSLTMIMLSLSLEGCAQRHTVGADILALIESNSGL
jgi:hypothetical protein